MTDTLSDQPQDSRICLARQPILNLKQNIIAYEMLFRQINATDAHFIDGTSATADVIVNLFNNIGLNNVIGNKKAFINFNQYLIQNDIVNILPKDRVVLEILEDVEVNAELFTRLEALAKSGYTLAIDDFIDNESTQRLFNIVDIMKIDITDYPAEKLAEYVKLGKQHKLTLLAERVETREEFLFCKSIGFELFQGYFFAKPEYIEKQSIPSNKISIMSILNDITAEKPIEDISKKITLDVSLNYKLLHYINSAGLRREAEISNIQDAIQLIGIKPLYRWLAVFMYTNDSNCSTESNTSLFLTALTRGFFLEYIAKHIDKSIADELFILGIFSYLDTLLKMSFSEILDEIHISENIKRALVSNSGPYQKYYQLALSNDSYNEIYTKDFSEINRNIFIDANLYAMQSANNLL